MSVPFGRRGLALLLIALAALHSFDRDRVERRQCVFIHRQPVSAKRQAAAANPHDQELVRVGPGVVNSQAHVPGPNRLRCGDPEIALGDQHDSCLP